MAHEFIDLGLPSGTLWATENEPEEYRFNEAVKKYHKELPSITKWRELFNKCAHEWDDDRKGYIFTGPNGNILFLPATSCISLLNKDEEITGTYHSAAYWSSTPNGNYYARYAYFSEMWDLICCTEERLRILSVRLCKQA